MTGEEDTDKLGIICNIEQSLLCRRITDSWSFSLLRSDVAVRIDTVYLCNVFIRKYNILMPKYSEMEDDEKERVKE